MIWTAIGILTLAAAFACFGVLVQAGEIARLRAERRRLTQRVEALELIEWHRRGMHSLIQAMQADQSAEIASRN